MTTQDDQVVGGGGLHSTTSTNEEILQCLKSNSLNSVSQTLFSLLPPQTQEDVLANSINKSLSRLKHRYQVLNKSRNKKDGKQNIASFLAQLFHYPSASLQTRGPRPSSSHHATEEVYEQVATSLALELQTQKEETGKSSETCKKLEEKLQTTTNELADQLNSTISAAVTVNLARQNLKRTQKREQYYRMKVSKTEDKVVQSQVKVSEAEERVCDIQDDLQELKDELLQLKDENKSLRCDLQNERAKQIETFNTERNCFNDSLTRCVYGLLEQHVSVSRVASVIKTVSSTLMNKECQRLPSKSTVESMNLQRLAIAQKQLAEETASKQDTTLYSDETSKYGDKVMGYHLSDSNKRFWVLGLRDICTKSAADTLSTFKLLLNDIDAAAASAKSAAGKSILLNVSNTMSDRAATETKFHTLLEEYRQEVLPEVYSGWEEMTEEEQLPLSSLSSFFCGLHSLIQYAETAESSLEELEKSYFGEKKGGAAAKNLAFKSEEKNGVMRTIRAVSKAFARGGCERSGVYGKFKEYVKPFLQKCHLNSIPIVPFRGNRFNIIFFNSAYIYLFHKEIVNFLNSYGPDNPLLKVVLYDLQEPFYVAGLKALGLVSKFITSPLWRILEDNNVHILEMTAMYKKILTVLEEATKNPSAFMEGQLLFVNEGDIQRDATYDCLITPGEYDAIVQSMISVILPAISSVIKRQQNCEDQTEASFDEDKTRSVVKHKFPERVFAYLDHLMKTRPNSSSIANEATIMFCLNKTGDWLESKSEEDRAAIISKARKEGRSLHQQYKKRLQDIHEEKIQQLKQREREIERKKTARVNELERYTQDIIMYGLWQSVQDVDEHLDSYPTIKEKLAALKAQLRFRQYVLIQQTENKAIFSFSKDAGDAQSKRRRQLSFDELAINVKALVMEAFTAPTQLNEDETNHPLLVHRQIRHRFSEDSYIGRVISRVPGYPAWYNVVYSGDDAVYTYKLLEDYTRGDLEILVD